MFEYELHIYLLTIVVFVSIEMLFFTVFDISIIDTMTNIVNSLLNTNFYFRDYVYLAAGIAGLLIAFKRDNWLPFLGRSVFPHSILQQQSPQDATQEITVNVKEPNAKVIYWASKDTNNETTPVFEAYDDFSNAGVAISNSNGDAILKVRKSTGYIVPNGKYIKRHVHYRLAKDEYSMLGSVNTKYY
tara:strand:- start:64 stop:624 length:561 start_codon:yes stop_codon:yes gene_type:complete